MEEKQLQAELQSIRHLMERSTKFISLSGLSGILAGCYAILGGGAAYYFTKTYPQDPGILLIYLIITGVLVLLAAIGTAYYLSSSNARRAGQKVWNPASQGLFRAMAVPLLTGGFVVAILLWQQHYAFIIPSFLIFYGLALVAGGQFTFRDFRALGYIQIVLGLIALAMPGHDLLFWLLGFGFFHLLYGSMMYFKYERRKD